MSDGAGGICTAPGALGLAPLCLFLMCALSACSRDTSDAGPRAAAAVVAIALQSDEYRDVRAALPLELDYALPARLPSGQTYVLDIALRTPLARGVLEIDVERLAGVALVGEPQRRIDIATAAQPLHLQLQIVPQAQAPRSLELSIALRGRAGLQQRNWHVELPPE